MMFFLGFASGIVLSMFVFAFVLIAIDEKWPDNWSNP